jgi:site-specific recombinase XerD
MNTGGFPQQTTLNFLQDDYLLIWVDAFLRDRRARNLTAGTVKFYQEKLQPFTNYCEAHAVKQISQITSTLIREFLLHLDDRGNNPGGIHACYRSLKAFLNWYWDEIEPDGRNPISRVSAPKVDIEPLDPANIEDVRKMIKFCANNMVGKRDKAMMLFLLDVGVRAFELLAINLDEIDVLTGEVFIRKGKGRKPRTVFLGSTSLKSVRQYLKLRRDNCNALWISKDKERLTYWGLVEVMRRRSEQAKVPKPSIHSFRYFFALTSLRNGMDVFSLQKAGGWASMAVMRRYLKQVDSDVETAMKRYSPVDNLT